MENLVVWNPARHHEFPMRPSTGSLVKFSVQEIWDGKIEKTASGQNLHVCNGLIADLVEWQIDPEDNAAWEIFQKILAVMGPPSIGELRLGKPVKLASDSRKIPTLELPYGAVPVLFASAGIKRILALGYLLVWSWMDYAEMYQKRESKLESRLVLLIDEIEAHLHPKWQRQIIRSVVQAVEAIGESLEVQLHVATHSPLVLAAMEPFFDQDMDALFLLSGDDDISLSALDFVKCGSVERWLESQSFGLTHARSFEAEQAIEAAKGYSTEQESKSGGCPKYT